MQSLHKNAFNKPNWISELSPAYLRCAQNSYIIGTYPHHKSRSICNCLPLFFSPEEGETDEHFVDVIEHKNKNTISKKNNHTSNTANCSRVSVVYPHDCLAGWELRFVMPSITKEDRTAYCQPGQRSELKYSFHWMLIALMLS